MCPPLCHDEYVHVGCGAEVVGPVECRHVYRRLSVFSYVLSVLSSGLEGQHKALTAITLLLSVEVEPPMCVDWNFELD